jgi:hypothetical protein
MAFSTTFRTFAFPSDLIDQLPALIEQFGEDAQDGNQTIKTICCGWDDTEHTRMRALMFPTTASLTDLVDGRKAYTALWVEGLLAAFEAGQLPSVQELTIEELQDLIPKPVIDQPEETTEN